jgi:hypothetical protein
VVERVQSVQPVRVRNEMQNSKFKLQKADEPDKVRADVR